MKKFPKVTKNDYGIRPAGRQDECFYCHRKVGEEHGPDCVVITKLVKMKYTIELDIEVPHSWSKEQIEFYKNESSWCANGVLHEIEKHIKRNENEECLCASFEAEYLRTTDDTPRRTKD